MDRLELLHCRHRHPSTVSHKPTPKCHYRNSIPRRTHHARQMNMFEILPRRPCSQAGLRAKPWPGTALVSQTRRASCVPSQPARETPHPSAHIVCLKTTRPVASSLLPKKVCVLDMNMPALSSIVAAITYPGVEMRGACVVRVERRRCSIPDAPASRATRIRPVLRCYSCWCCWCCYA